MEEKKKVKFKVVEKKKTKEKEEKTFDKEE